MSGATDDAEEQRTTFRGFPDWMYDDNRWNDLGYMLNQQTVEISGRGLAVAAGFRSARFPDGYEVFTPPESAYDRVKVRNKLWGKKGPHEIEAVDPPYAPTDAQRASWQFPALPWLDDILSRFQGRVVLAFMPAHVSAQPVPGSAKAARSQECKRRIEEMAKRYRASLVDFNIKSEITSKDDNYWDRLHYREPIADRIVADLAEALTTGADRRRRRHGDRDLRRASFSPLAWRPGRAHVLAHVSGSHLDIRDVDADRLLARIQLPHVANGIAWSADGTRLYANLHSSIAIYDARGRRTGRIRMPLHWTATTFVPARGGSLVAVARRNETTSEVALMAPGARDRVLFRADGRFTRLRFSPGGRWLLVAWPLADQWVYLRPGASGASRVLAATRVSRRFRGAPQVSGWCCPP